MTKRYVVLALAAMLVWGGGIAQADKGKIKELEKRYATFSKHKKFFDVDRWAMVKFHIVYKLTTSHVTKAMDKKDFAKVKSSSGAYGILQGVSEDDLQRITDQVAENFIRRMREEAGIEIVTWSSFADSPNTAKLEAAAEDREIYSKSQGLGYAVSYDGTPVWNRVIALVPGGKKLARELGAHNGMLTMYVDFADAVAEAGAWIDKQHLGTSYSYDGLGTWTKRTSVRYTWGETAEQSVVPVVRIEPNLGSQSAWEQATNLGSTQVAGQAANLYTFNMTYAGAEPERLASPLPYADKVEELAGELPEVLANRRNDKIEYVRTFVVHTTPDKYGAAVMDATNRFFDDVIAYYNLVSP